MVYANVIQSMGAILTGMYELKISLGSPKSQVCLLFTECSLMSNLPLLMAMQAPVK